MIKPKIWKEWKEIAINNCYSLDIPKLQCNASIVAYESKVGFYLILVIDGKCINRDFKTKEQAMLKAQSLIIKELKKIEKVVKKKC